MLTDPADCVLNTAICALREWFTPDSSQPPVGGGGTVVRAFAGDVLPIAAFDFHTNDPDCGCDKPFLWVRLVRRYRSNPFPQPVVSTDPCQLPRAIAVEIGVARCAATAQPECDWTAYETEAEVSLDDSWRIEQTLCLIKGRLAETGCSDMVATDAVLPYGPEGGVLGWIGTFYARLDKE